MSDMKYNAITGSGIKVTLNIESWRPGGLMSPQVLERVPIPDDMIPADAHVEIDAKMYAGYYVPEEKRAIINDDFVKQSKGRGLDA
mmetsp:Transcript_5691/g.20034  ORF Transcript_5691/g.20034 Transcript_5691/m.20034 type:complete len:86 (-) Transcript_5691:86-343(-)